MAALVPPRSDAPERMDRPGLPRELLEAALRDLAWVNRRFGGERALRRALRPWLALSLPGSFTTILDLGTGSADLPLAMIEAGRHLGRRVEVVAVDRNPQILAIASRRLGSQSAVHLVRADARDLPFGAGSFDVVTLSLFLHHFDGPAVVEVLRRCLRLARRAVIVNDLRRTRLAWWLVRHVGSLGRCSALFRHDAPLSVLRAFTPDELLEAARAAGARRATVTRRWPFRLVLVCEGA
jgi:SAM-dependent methyltransferase